MQLKQKAYKHSTKISLEEYKQACISISYKSTSYKSIRFSLHRFDTDHECDGRTDGRLGHG